MINIEKMTLNELYKLRALIEQAVKSLTDEDALDGVTLFPHWRTDTEYTEGERIAYEDKLYRVVQAHTSQADWMPGATPALYTEVAKPGEIPVWRQPTGAQDAYNTGDKVHYPDADGPVYESTVDNNVWNPADYPAGWKIVE